MLLPVGGHRGGSAVFLAVPLSGGDWLCGAASLLGTIRVMAHPKHNGWAGNVEGFIRYGTEE